MSKYSKREFLDTSAIHLNNYICDYRKMGLKSCNRLTQYDKTLPMRNQINCLCYACSAKQLSGSTGYSK